MKVFGIFVLILSVIFASSLTAFLVIDNTPLYFEDSEGNVSESVVSFDYYRNTQTAGNIVYGRFLNYVSFLNSVVTSVISDDSNSHPLLKEWYADLVDEHYGLLDRARLTPFSVAMYDGYQTVLRQGFYPYNIDMLKVRFPSYSTELDELRLILRQERTSYVDGLGTLTFVTDNSAYPRIYTINPSADDLLGLPNQELVVDPIYKRGIYYHDFDSLDVECVCYGAFLAEGYASFATNGYFIFDISRTTVYSVSDCLAYQLAIPDSMGLYGYLKHRVDVLGGSDWEAYSFVVCSTYATLTDYIGYNYDYLPLAQYSITFYPNS